MKNDTISRQTVLRCIKESRDNIDWGQSEDGDAFLHYTGALYRTVASEECLPSAEPEDYTELKQEFIRMAEYIDIFLKCPDEQKETLYGFVERIAEHLPWTKED